MENRSGRRDALVFLYALIILAVSYRFFTHFPILKLYHPPAIACDVTAALLLIPYVNSMLRGMSLRDWESFPVLGALMAWVGFGWILTDRPCLAGFCGALSIALMASVPMMMKIKDVRGCEFLAKAIIPWQGRAGIFLFIAACILGPLTP